MVSLDFKKFKEKVTDYDQGEEGLDKWFTQTSNSLLLGYVKSTDVINLTSVDLLMTFFNSRDYVAEQKEQYPCSNLQESIDRCRRVKTKRRLL